MALVVADRIQETTTTTGTGTITLAGAVSGFQTFAVIGNGNTTYYCITSGSDWEVGIGTYSTTGPTLARTTILASSAAGAAITLAGTSTVFCTYPASKSFNLDQVLPLADGGTGATSAPAARAALMGFATTATAGSTTTLTNTSSVYQVFTGSSAQTVALPSTATLAQGWFFHICNNSTGTLTVQTSTAVSLGTVPSGATVMVSCVDTTVNTAAAWEWGYTDFSTITGTGAAVLATSPTVTDLLLTAGTATVPPLQFTAGTNLTTAAAGAMEYDGEMLYFSPLASTRTIVPNTQATVLATTYTLTSQTAAQKLFNTSTNGAVTLDTGIYQFECSFRLSAMSTTSGSFGFALGGTATINQTWWASAVKNTLSTLAAWTSSFQTAATTTLATATTSSVGACVIRGLIRVTAAGTVIPQVSLTVAAAATVEAYSYFTITKLSGGTANFTTGNWS